MKDTPYPRQAHPAEETSFGSPPRTPSRRAVRPERKRLYDRVQELVAEELPIVPLVSPNVLVGAKDALANFRPAILDHYTLWNADELFWRPRTAARRP